jgi:hypothetical protein
MNDRFKQPKRKQKLPAGKSAKCALAYSILVENLVEDGIPHEVADLMATDVVTTVLETTVRAEEDWRLRYSIYATVCNN